MNLTIAKKMLFMGIAIFVGLLTMGLVINRIDTNVNDSLSLSELRGQQLEVVNIVHEAQLSLLLAAMDSIVDKDAGEIDAERRQIISETTQTISNNLGTLAELADTTEEKRLAQQLKESLLRRICG